MKLKCNLCKANIIIDEERYIHLEDWNKKDIVSEIWSHLRCYNTAIFHGQRNLEKQAKQLIDKMIPIVNQLTNENKIFYDLK